MAKVLALLMMPPPVHGASGINARMVAVMGEAGIEVDLVNLVPSPYARHYSTRWWRWLRAIWTVRSLIAVLLRAFRRPRSVYFGISGGRGQLLDCLFACCLLLIRRPVYVHHHSFAYINSFSPIFSVLVRLLRPCGLTHIVLCEEMRAGLLAGYPELVKGADVLVLSNAAFFEAVSAEVKLVDPARSFCIGYMSNITVEKGIDSFIHLFLEARKMMPNLRAKVAGPCMDETVRKMIRDAVASTSDFEYIGPVSGQDKHAFFSDIDLFVFPTRYVNEAEPLVIYEAASAGVPSISSDRGCIASMIQYCGGYAVPAGDDFVNSALMFLERSGGADSWGDMNGRAQRGMAILQQGHAASLNMLLHRMTKV